MLAAAIASHHRSHGWSVASLALGGAAMSNVISFPVPRVAQIVVGRTVGEPGRRFFVTISDEEMRGEITWDGLSYSDALRAADEWVRQGYRLDDVYGRGARMKIAANENWNGDNYFGVCPHCRRHDGYANFGREHWFFCREHRLMWRVGENLFSDWRHEPADEQLRAWNRIGLHTFRAIALAEATP